MKTPEAAEHAKTKLSAALKKKAHSTVSIHEEEKEWKAVVEVLEETHIPSSDDLIGVYDVSLDKEGELVSWTRKGARKRG